MDKQKIDILLSTSVWDSKPWIKGLGMSDAIGKIHIWPTNEDLAKVEALFVWKPLAEGVLERLPNLKWISSLGAGVDHLMTDPQIPVHIPITRIVDPRLTIDMGNYVLMSVIMHQRNFKLQQQHQKTARWERITYRNLRVGIMGLGELGGHVACQLRDAGFIVAGFSRTKKSLDGIETFDQNRLSDFLANLDVLVNLLPITPSTIGILNYKLLNQTPKGCYLINVARGNHLIDNDLLQLLEEGHLSGAMLDVFNQEPLPSAHPFWGHSKITVTPHVASVTTPESAINLLLENTERLVQGENLLHQVDLKRGY